jgi:RAC serine/threonine-protein kinase
MLIYYKDPEGEVKPTNFFILAGCRVNEYEKLGPGAFEIIMANGENRYIQAKSKADRDDWIQCLRHEAIARKPSSQLSKSRENVSDFLNKKIRIEDFNLIKVLGKGNYGKVLLATLKNKPDNYFALKVIKKSSLIDEESLEHVLAENRVLHTLDHPFLVKLYNSFQSEDHLYFVMEYVSGGELFFHIGREKRFSEERVRFYASEILLALHYLHQKGIVYRDLKLENLLLDTKGHIKITDFGLCKEGIGDTDTTATFCGTPEYLAPEILEEENYGKSVDWWALGVVMYELLVGRPPFGPANDIEKLFHNIVHKPINFPETLSPKAQNILKSLLEREFMKRLGSGPKDGEEIMDHEFFSDMDWKKLLKKEIQAPFVPQVVRFFKINIRKESRIPKTLTKYLLNFLLF